VAREKTPAPKPSHWPIKVAAIGFFLAEIAVLRGAASPFRLPKDAIVLATLVITCAIAVWAASRRRTITLPTGRIAGIFAALPILQAISALWSASPLRALESAAFTAIWVVGLFWATTIGSDGRSKVAMVAASGVIVSAAVMMLQIGGVHVFRLAGESAKGRVSNTGLTGNPSDLAMAAVLLLPLILAGWEKPSRSWLRAAFALILAMATLLTRSLSGIAALVLLVFVWLYQQRSKRLWISATAILTALLILALATGLGSRITEVVYQIRTGKWYELFSARGDGWTAAAEMVRARPLTGVGAANYDHLYYPSRLSWFDRHGGVGKRGQLASHFSWAHSDPLQLTAELGVVGLIWLLFLAAVLVKQRERAGPALALGAAALTPLALLHYPTHLAVGLVPIALISAEVVASIGAVRTVEWRTGRMPAVAALSIVALVVSGWQIQRVAADVWKGSLESILEASRTAPLNIRTQRSAAVEASILGRIDRMPHNAPELWRTVGRARYMRSDYAGSETAFREAFKGWPHEDADFYLGLSLVAQGRRNEGIQHLARVCRTNPTLVRLIRDRDLRRSVEDVLEAYRAQ
jgi:O-antigen ligase